MECIVLALQPFSFAEKNAIRKLFKYQPITVDTMMKYHRKVTNHVEKNVSTFLQDRFAVIFDGWSGVETHYVAVFSYFPSAHTSGYSSLLLSLASMGDEDNIRAEYL